MLLNLPSLTRYLSVGIILIALLGSCGERMIVDSNDRMSGGVVRLGDNPVAEVDGTKIYLSDVERTARAQKLIAADTQLTPSSPVFAKVLDELIDQRLLALDALRRSLDQQDEVKRRLAVSRERILSSILVENHLKETVNEDTIKQMYEAQAGLRGGGQEVWARHILVKTEDEIKAVAKKLAAGADFGELAGKHSIDRASKDDAGDLGYINADMFSPEFSKVAFATEKNTHSAPFKTTYGWHIVEVLGRRKGEQPSFAAMRGQILQFMTYDEIQKLVKNLRAGGEVKLLFGQAAVDTDTAEDTLNPSPKLNPSNVEPADE